MNDSLLGKFVPSKTTAQYWFGVILFVIYYFLITYLISITNLFDDLRGIVLSVSVGYFLIAIILSKKNKNIAHGYIMAFPAFLLFVAMIIVEIMIHPPEEE